MGSFAETGFGIIQNISLHLVTLTATDAILWISSPLDIFNSLGTAAILLLQEYEPGLLCFFRNIWGTRFHPVFVWSSKYLGEAEDSFHLKHVFTSLEQRGSEKGTGKEPAISFPPWLLACFWASVCAHALPPPRAALLHRDFLVKSSSSVWSNDWNTVYKIMAFFHLKKNK